MYMLCLIGLWTRSPKTEVEKLRIERLEVFLNVFAGFVTSSVGSESAPHFYKSPFGSWVRALMEAKENDSWDLP